MKSKINFKVDKDVEKKGQEPSHYVAVGASAGGLEAIDSLFTNMPADSGLAFIVIQHLSPDYKSLMVELLSKKTKMPVHRAEDQMQVLPNNVYLIPPKKNLTIFHGKLLLSEQDHYKGINLPIDIFLKSLAEDQGEKAISIILSGTGSDGTRGLRVIKERGGMVMVQKEDTAKFDGMPRAAISTGLSDFILPPEEMPKQLLSFAKHPYSAKIERSETLLSNEDGLTKIFSILREKCKVDFTFYKPSTVTRRIERRMTINQIEDINQYNNFLQNYPGEATALYRELLIGVTSFFRDQEAFDAIANKWMPELLGNSVNKEIRFWVTGCSTGEEAYSLAIIAKECMEKLNLSIDIKIFATDIDKEAIHFAAQGTYPESIVADLSPKYLSKYFYKKDDTFQIIRPIREMVVFAQHNLIKDPPFTNISLLSCRNLLIYLQPILQHKVFDFFNFSLLPGGILFLGTSESTGDKSDYFEVLEQKLKIYRSKGRTQPYLESSHLMTVTDTRARYLRDQYSGTRKQLKSVEEERVLERFIHTISKDYFPFTLIVNEQFEVIHTFGDVQEYFKLPTGKMINDITKMAIKELSVPLSTGIQKVFRQRTELRFSNIRIVNKDQEKIIEVIIKPLVEKKGQEPLVLIFLGEIKKSAITEEISSFQSYDLSKEAEEHLKELEFDLQFTRENLQATIEELETSNEELQATNEELLASNEELQSTNEELQSTNEELFTVNAEYQSKIIELTELHNDIDNLLGASLIGQLLLDENLEIRRFSPHLTNIFSLLNNDIGRPITHISHIIQNVDPITIINDVLKYSKTIEKEIKTQKGDFYLMRVSPYKISPKTFSGIVLSFVNINSLKKAEENLNNSEKKFKSLFDTMELGVVYQNFNGEIILANPAAERILGLSFEQMQGKKSIDPLWRSIREDGTAYTGDKHPSMIALKTGKKVKDVIMAVFNPKNKTYTWINICAIPQLMEGNKKPFQVYTIFEDITIKKKAEDLIVSSEEQYRLLFSELQSGIALHQMIYDKNNKPIDYQFLKVNPLFEELTGIKANNAIGSTVKQLMPNIEQFWIDRYDQVVKTGKPIEFEEHTIALNKTFKVKAFRVSNDQFAVAFDEIKK